MTRGTSRGQQRMMAGKPAMILPSLCRRQAILTDALVRYGRLSLADRRS